MAVGCPLYLEFVGFWKGNEDCLFPDDRDLSVSAEVLQAEGAKVTELY